MVISAETSLKIQRNELQIVLKRPFKNTIIDVLRLGDLGTPPSMSVWHVRSQKR